MKTILLLAILALSFTSCQGWKIPSSENKYLTVLKRDGNLVKTKVRLASGIRVDAVTQDTMTSVVADGKATITTTVLIGVTVPAKTKGKIVEEEEGVYYFVFNNNAPGFELRIKEDEKTESIKATN